MKSKCCNAEIMVYFDISEVRCGFLEHNGKKFKDLPYACSETYLTLNRYECTKCKNDVEIKEELEKEVKEELMRIAKENYFNYYDKDK